MYGFLIGSKYGRNSVYWFNIIDVVNFGMFM